MRILNTRRKPERVLGERVALPVFEMVSCPMIRLADIGRRRFGIIDRAQRSAREEIAAREDRAVFAALDAVSGRDIVRSGRVAHIWGADIIVSGNIVRGGHTRGIECLGDCGAIVSGNRFDDEET